jgi:uncharacterized protein (DUF885 family)
MRVSVAVLGLLWMVMAPVAVAGSADRSFQAQFGDAFLERYWSFNPDQAIAVGHYTYADRLIVPDAAARDAYLAFIEQSLKKLERIDTAKLSPAARTDWALLKNQLESQRWTLTEFQDWQWNPANYNVAEAFALLLNTEYAPREQRLRAMLRRLEKVPAYYAAAIGQIYYPVREYTQLAIEQNEGALGVFGLQMERAVAGSGLSAQERALFFRRLEAAREAIRDYVAFLRELDATQDVKTRSFRIGRRLYERKFAYDIQSGASGAELYQRALAEKERLHADMDRLADQLWPKYLRGTRKPADRLEKIGTLIARISEKHVAREQFVAEVQRQIPLLEKWVTDHQLLTLDPSRPLEVRETPPHKRGFSIASVDAPGPYDPTARTFYNVSPLDAYTPEQAESFLREYNDYILQILNIHEAVPGHYVQLVYSNKSPSRIKALFGNGAMVEGWAVYAERMMLESGWGGDSPEMWLMYGKWNLRVVCNTILDYSLHVLGMNEAEAMRLLTREAFQSQTEATGKWRRARLSAVQLTSYFAGYAAIRDFRDQLRQAQGASFDLRRFHERFLSYGSAPVGVIRQLMTGDGRN